MTNTTEVSTGRRHRRNNPIMGGLVLIVLGIVFLAQQTGTFALRNWWALFILIPAFGSFAAAVAVYRRTGRFSAAMQGGLFSGLMTLAVALVFLLDLPWDRYWPLFVILPGLSLLFARVPLMDGPAEWAGVFAGPWVTFTGVGVTLLGLGFLAQNLGWYYPSEVMPRWWAPCIMLPALGGLIATLRLWTTGHAPMAALTSLVAAAIVGTVSLMALLDVDWNLLWPILLIAAGCVLLLSYLGSRRS